MLRVKFIESIKNTFAKGVELIERKNHDYAGVDNPFKNFESASIVGIPVERAILVRVLDKLSRVSNLLGSQASVKDEAIEDTLLDAINYLAILKAYLDDQRGRNDLPTMSDKL